MKPTQDCTAQVIDLNYFRSIKENYFFETYSGLHGSGTQPTGEHPTINVV